jgi:DNA-binding transcriptional LysR family regulator
MTFKQLEYFAAVARTLSFTDAANEVFVSQPALSRGISALEEELGVLLLSRNHHAVSLTPAGTLLASELPNLRKELERVIMLVRQTENGLMGHLRIGVLEGQQLDEALQVTFKYFSQSLPLVELSPLRMDGNELITGLLQNQLDVIFTVDFGLAENPELEILQLDSVPFCMVVPTDHRLANRTSCSIVEFAQDCILLDNGQKATGEADFFTGCCENAGFTPNVRSVVDNRTRLLWIESGFGVSAFNAASRACLSTSVRAIQLDDVPSAKLVLAWKRDCKNSSVRIFTHLAECCL